MQFAMNISELRKYEDQRYIVFGTGKYGEVAYRILGEKIAFYCSNDAKQGEVFHDIAVINANDLRSYYDGKGYTVVLAVVRLSYAIQIARQLDSKHIPFVMLEDIAKNGVLEEAKKYDAMSPPSTFGYNPSDNFLFPLDRYQNSGTISSYLWQDLWAARHILRDRPARHYDIGSRMDGFITHLLAGGINVVTIDIRPFPVDLPGLTFVHADATNLEGLDEESIDSLSALCSLEHFGLGRYGDPIDPEACFKCFNAISRRIRRGGMLYVAVPIGREHLEFNAHRVFAPSTIANAFDSFELLEFSTCFNAEYRENEPLDKYDSVDSGRGERFGLFRFKKR